MENLEIRNRIFWALFLVGLSLYIANDFYNWTDECLVAYALVSVFCFINLILFAWWWWVKGRATDVYKWLMVLMGGVMLTNVGNLHSRWYIHRGDMEAYLCVIQSFPWKYRAVPTMVALMYMLSLVVSRICCGEDRE